MATLTQTAPLEQHTLYTTRKLEMMILTICQGDSAEDALPVLATASKGAIRAALAALGAELRAPDDDPIARATSGRSQRQAAVA